MHMPFCQELREFSSSDAVKGKHFFLESDMRGTVLKMDTTGKAILTVSCVYIFEPQKSDLLRYVGLS